MYFCLILLGSDSSVAQPADAVYFNGRVITMSRKFTDFAVISKDFLSRPLDEIKDIEALQTVVDGKTVYKSASGWKAKMRILSLTCTLHLAPVVPTVKTDREIAKHHAKAVSLAEMRRTTVIANSQAELGHFLPPQRHAESRAGARLLGMRLKPRCGSKAAQNPTGGRSAPR